MRSMSSSNSPPASAALAASAAAQAAAPERSDTDTLKRLFPYLWEYKWRVIASLSFMVGAKMATVSVPPLLKYLVDTSSLQPGSVQAVFVVPAALL